jgi:hypothetical protein
LSHRKRRIKRVCSFVCVYIWYSVKHTRRVNVCLNRPSL